LPDGNNLLDVARSHIDVGIVQTDESDVGLVWAIYVAKFPDFWLNAYRSFKAAQKTCEKMGWHIVQITPEAQAIRPNHQNI
jgi:hypothetical protein